MTKNININIYLPQEIFQSDTPGELINAAKHISCFASGIDCHGKEIREIPVSSQKNNIYLVSFHLVESNEAGTTVSECPAAGRTRGPTCNGADTDVVVRTAFSTHYFQGSLHQWERRAKVFFQRDPDEWDWLN